MSDDYQNENQPSNTPPQSYAPPTQSYAPPTQGYAPPQSASTGSYADAKRRSIAVILTFPGCFGLDDFYLGFTKRGLTKLIVTVIGIILNGIGAATGLTAISVIGSIIVVVMVFWNLFRAFRLLTGSTILDAKGVPLR
ncbi:MAG: NINE protein [Clostridiales Family XIII bacterium]|nr:NINE protein [Clostridiales Family XIII bacterium]